MRGSCFINVFLVQQNTVTEGAGDEQGQKKSRHMSREDEWDPQGFSVCPTGATVITHRGDVVVIPRAKTTIEDEQKSIMPPSQFLTVAPVILTITAGDQGVDRIALLDQGCRFWLTKLFRFRKMNQ